MNIKKKKNVYSVLAVKEIHFLNRMKPRKREKINENTDRIQSVFAITECNGCQPFPLHKTVQQSVVELVSEKELERERVSRERKLAENFLLNLPIISKNKKSNCNK